MRDHKFANNELAYLRHKVRELERRVRMLENAQVTTLPLYDQPGYFTGDGVEGQLVIDATNVQLQYRLNGVWNPV